MSTDLITEPGAGSHLSLPVIEPVWPSQHLSQMRSPLQDLIVYTDAAAPAAETA